MLPGLDLLDLATVELPVAKVAEQAVAGMARLLNDPDSARVELRVPGRVVLRASLGARATTQP